MGIYFGTDGIRGIYGEELSPSLAYKTGNSLSRFCKNKKVLIGKDSRSTGDILTLSLSSGLLNNGVDVIDVGLCPTPCIAYLTKKLGFDFGVMISASHNPPEYNGIKIFDKDGYKINEEFENQIERKIMFELSTDYKNIGKYKYSPRLINKYIESIVDISSSLENLKIVVDCANGASTKVAKKVFKNLNSNCFYSGMQKNGLKINEKCGALHIENLKKLVKKHNADIGFAFDGDADRIMVCDENGKTVDGDEILYLLSKYLPEKCPNLVGTTLTNKALEDALAKNHIKLIRADVGDKYVIEIMKNKNILLGGEPSGHIIVKSHSTTGDGVLTAVMLANILNKSEKKLSKLIDYTPYPQENKNVAVVDKFRILNSSKLTKEILKLQQKFKDEGRVLVRASGTEQKIRIMCEHKDKEIAKNSAIKLEKIVEEINNQM